MDEFLKSVCDKHGLTALSVTYIAENHEPFSVYPHRGDDCAGGSGTTIDSALADALADMSRRFPTRRDGPVLREGV